MEKIEEDNFLRRILENDGSQGASGDWSFAQSYSCWLVHRPVAVNPKPLHIVVIGGVESPQVGSIVNRSDAGMSGQSPFVCLDGVAYVI